jgi:hypothetical protein
MERNRGVRVAGILLLALVVFVTAQRAAVAQDVNEDYIVHHLGPAAEAMQRAGLDGSGESSPAMIEIGQRWAIDAAYEVSVDEARMLVRAEREDRDGRTRASLTSPLDAYPARLFLARFGVVTVGLTCGEAQNKARTAQRLADSLSRMSQLNAAGTGLIGAISLGAARFVAPMAFATAVTGFASVWAAQLANGYRNAPCLTGGQQWRFRANVQKTSLSQDRSHVPPSSPGRPGLRCAGLLTGATSMRPLRAHPFLSPRASGRSSSL